MSGQDFLTFTGYTTAESIIAFLEAFEGMVAIKGFDAVRQRLVLVAALRGPAKAAFQAAVNTGAAAGIRPINAAGPPVITAETHLEDCKAWLRNQYHTKDMCQGIKSQISTIYQGMNESPQAFYTKIRHLIDLANYADAVKDQVAETAFVNGLQRELADLVQTAPMVLTLTQKVDYAHRYWTRRNPTANIWQQTLAPNLRNLQDRVLPELPQTADTLIPRPAQVDWTKAKENTQFDELAKKFDKLTAHISDLDK